MTTNAELKRLAEGAEVTLDPSEALKPVYAFLAAANPARIIALVDEVERLRGALERIVRQKQTCAYDEVEPWYLQDIARQALATGEGE